ncbi:MAG TPA: glycoside hydrolase 100 family protein [Burkholderiales bacterium]|nr:glycoside hydrolase 100 family protein [Burkholderiales bacterium]
MSDALVEECRQRALELLRANVGPAGMRAATPGTRAQQRHYDAVFGRDASICALGMALSGDPALRQAAALGLATLAARQAANGQIPKLVDGPGAPGDFWYVGCIDATLWWLLAVDFLGLRRRFAREVPKALAWLRCQEHPRWRLLQQNEASDWADIMPRTGFVLYTNALWVGVLARYAPRDAARTRTALNTLLYPLDRTPLADRRARLLAEEPRRRASLRELYVSYLNLSHFGDEGDVVGNLLAILYGVPDAARARRVLGALRREHAGEPYPVRAVCRPIEEESPQWRPYLARHRQNFPWQYHNGGIWPFAGGLYVAALAQAGLAAEARRALVSLARANALDGWAFNEWLYGLTGVPRGMRGQSWNAAGFLIAHRAVARTAAGTRKRPRAAGRAAAETRAGPW